MMSRLVPLPLLAACVAFGLSLLGCEDSGKKSAALAQAHTEFLVKAATQDVAEVRAGLPKGAALLAEGIEGDSLPDAQTARKLLENARDGVQDLRIAKSTFFALVDASGVVIRNDQDQDRMAGQNLLSAFSDLKQAFKKPYVESSGSMPEAAGVRGKPDAQWVAACPVTVGGTKLGLYVTGWSWSAYAYRLETGLRGDVLANTEAGDKVPLLYVYVIADNKAYGAPISPRVNGDAILKLNPMKTAAPGKPFVAPLEIDGRSFGVAVAAVPALGTTVGIAVLRSET